MGKEGCRHTKMGWDSAHVGKARQVALNDRREVPQHRPPLASVPLSIQETEESGIGRC